MIDYPQVKKLLSDRIGLDPESLGSGVIKNEADCMMSELGIGDLSSFVDRLKKNEEEFERLIERIVIPETWFYRDRESYRFLGHYAKELLNENGRGVVRILSAPCSTGEEPYSVAMTLLDAGFSPGDFVVDAVDISRRALEHALRAEYGKGSFRTEKQRPDRYFVLSEGGWKLDATVAACVNFVHDNILRPGFFPDRDRYRIVFCKNLLIYLDRNGRRRLFENLERLLLPGGLLFTGHSELASFLQSGYLPVAHSRSFACIKASETEVSRGGKGETVVAAKKSPVKSVKKIEPSQAIPVTLRHRMEGAGDRHRKREPGDSPLIVIRRMADRGSLLEALDLCRKYLQGSGPDKEGYYLMGLIDQALDRPDEAEEMFMKVLYLDPYHYDALLHMALLSEKKADDARALVFRERIKRLDQRATVPGGAGE